MKILILSISLLIITGCSTIKQEVQPVLCPPCPIAGPKVASELEKVCDDTKCPNTIDWLNRYAKVCDILKEK